jgi:type I restriction enzyme S subunit
MSEITYVKLSSVIKPPISGKRPSGGVNTETEGIPSLGGENIFQDGGVDLSVIKKITCEFYHLMSKGKLKYHDVLINKDGAQTGKVGLYEGNFNEAAVNEHLFILRPNDEKELNSIYLYYSVLLPETQIKIERRITGSAQPGLNSKFINSVDIPYHSLSEQRKIKNILILADKVIKNTEVLIKKYEQIMSGLMHDLFTRGVTAEGKLRLPSEEALEFYQETALGRIPKEWNENLLKHYVSHAEYGISTSLNDDENGIPVLRMNNIKNGKFELSDLKYSNIINSGKIRLKLNDVLYNRTNSMEHVGKTAIWKSEIRECAFASYLVRINFHEELLLPTYFTYWINQISSQNKLRCFATPAVQQVNINPTNLQKIVISVPNNILEQEKIVGCLERYDSLLNHERQMLMKFRMQKKGLMHDLLTGKVRVSVKKKGTADV